MKLSRRELIMIMAMVWILIGAVYYYLIYTPERSKLELLQQTNYQLKQQKTGHKVIAADTENDVLREYQKLLEKIPEQQFLPEILALVNETANQSETELSGINYGNKNSQNTENLLGENDAAKKEVNKNAPYQTIPIEYEVRGNYYQIKSFIQIIEKCNRLITINDLKLLAAPAKQEEVESPIAEDQTNAETETAPQLVGSAAYDGNSLIMTIKLTAFYDTKSIKDRSGVSDLLAPPSKTKENPYTK